MDFIDDNIKKYIDIVYYFGINEIENDFINHIVVKYVLNQYDDVINLYNMDMVYQSLIMLLSTD